LSSRAQRERMRVASRRIPARARSRRTLRHLGIGKNHVGTAAKLSSRAQSRDLA